ncbi:hypothetical protein EUZ85_15745 [Hahella sp. KA22]|uniref:RHS repeat domain-containing protein n=1 Tax=Hahella sp. KA22 TaxID=1628392 RepID=UPI000FDE9C7A|nr:RHS repeat-associated core domain-containing protein [Hahella sp. KA22]AZZ92101.1 hypothetical protein ENC22_13180 [Hahella sp. KA22]QAY55471.1 hypothetical protein EUZ85_15745 [Hahella sp. KA22]
MKKKIYRLPFICRQEWLRVAFFLTAACFSNIVLAENLVTYYHNDSFGSLMAATEEHGYLLWRKSYTPYGKEIGKDALSTKSRIGFLGSEVEVRTGLNYMRGRYYDPLAGRYMSLSPLEFNENSILGINRYIFIDQYRADANKDHDDSADSCFYKSSVDVLFLDFPEFFECHNPDIF